MRGPATTARGPVPRARTKSSRPPSGRRDSQKRWTSCRGPVITLNTSATPGRYTMQVASSTAAGGTATLNGSYPGRPAREVIAYDANDHAVSIDDGTSTIAETLSPSGRVLRRVVTDDATGEVLEDTDFGYAGAGDSPAYARPHGGGGTVTTYLSGVVYTGTVGVWHLGNLHGDVVGTTNADGVFTVAPETDEFGVGQAPADRLGWLGGKDRFNVGGGLGLIRMGVRLYDTRLGRFLQVDPIEGGSANDYDYCNGDPINCFDLGGTTAATDRLKQLELDLFFAGLDARRWQGTLAGLYYSGLVRKLEGRVARQRDVVAREIHDVLVQASINRQLGLDIRHSGPRVRCGGAWGCLGSLMGTLGAATYRATYERGVNGVAGCSDYGPAISGSIIVGMVFAGVFTAGAGTAAVAGGCAAGAGLKQIPGVP